MQSRLVVFGPNLDIATLTPFRGETNVPPLPIFFFPTVGLLSGFFWSATSCKQKIWGPVPSINPAAQALCRSPVRPFCTNFRLKVSMENFKSIGAMERSFQRGVECPFSCGSRPITWLGCRRYGAVTAAKG